MTAFKIVKLPVEEDHIKNCISTVGKYLHEYDGNDSVYLDLMIEVLVDHLNSFPEGHSRDLDIAQAKLEEARFRIERHFVEYDEVK